MLQKFVDTILMALLPRTSSLAGTPLNISQTPCAIRDSEYQKVFSSVDSAIEVV